MTNKIFTLTLFIFFFLGCTRQFKKEIKVTIDKNKIGWYFVFIENVNDDSSAKDPIELDLSVKNYGRIKLDEPSMYRLKIYDLETQEEISNSMELIFYSGNYDSLQVCQFYNPDELKYPKTETNSELESSESDRNRDLLHESFIMLDSIIEREGINWYKQVN